MCGIIGGYKKGDVEEGLTMLLHRGPDAHSILEHSGVFLGHTRLAIIDPVSSSNQPFTYYGLTLVYTGEGSAELLGSYGFAGLALKKESWCDYRKKLFQGQSRKNFMRCNKSFMAYGVEARLPFAAKPYVEYLLSLPEHTVRKSRNPKHWKELLTLAYKDVLPIEILTAYKLGFQDGCGLKKSISTVFSNPKKVYANEYRRIYG